MKPIRPIKTDEDLQAAFASLETVFQAADNTPEPDEMEILVALIEAYENKHYPIYPPNPIAALEFRMEQQGLTRRDLKLVHANHQYVLWNFGVDVLSGQSAAPHASHPCPLLGQ